MPSLTVPSAPGLKTAWRHELDDYGVALKWAPKARTLVVGTSDGTVTVFDGNGQVLARWSAHRNGLNALAWSANGQRLATGGQDGQARIWDPNTGLCVEEIPTEAQWVECVAYSPREEHLAITAGRKLAIWSGKGNRLEQYPDQPSTIADIDWQPDSVFFAVACYGKLSIYQVGSTKPVKEFAWKGSILRVKWSPDGDFIATGNQDATVHFWYRKSGRDLEMSGYPFKVRELSWDTDSRLLATGGGPAVTVWNCSGKGPAGTRPIELQGHVEPVSALCFQHKGALLASGARDGRVCIWKIKDPGKPVAGVQFDSAISQLAWSTDGRFLAALTREGQLAVFNIADGV
ncbi:MAG TPA: hypothetical protein VHZ55_17135 [Bryobacteraceae bacterium]|jgi:dipeptidyl aminopeptidase/acylaminoacyl peptidase|nr:hypothetical protein [Bryobacteraceae bacterium]